MNAPKNRAQFATIDSIMVSPGEKKAEGVLQYFSNNAG
jgi:hypothetical protein